MSSVNRGNKRRWLRGKNLNFFFFLTKKEVKKSLNSIEDKRREKGKIKQNKTFSVFVNFNNSSQSSLGNCLQIVS